MGTICRIYERTGRGVKVVAIVRDGKVTGEKAASIRKVLQKFGFPDAPIEDVMDEFLITSPGLGVAFVPPMDGEEKT